MYITRKSIYISFEYDLEWRVNLTTQDGYQSPCFAFKIIENGNLYDPHSLMLLRQLRLICYITNYEEVVTQFVVTRDMNIQMFFLLFIATINHPHHKKIYLKETNHYMNARCRIIQVLPNGIEKWFKVKNKKKKKYVQDKLFLYLTQVFDEIYLNVFESGI